jgi:glycosyltransferase involved in cell wall biosynthesis
MAKRIVLWIGPYLSTGGYATVTRSYVRSLLTAGVDLVILPIGPDKRHVLTGDELDIFESHRRLETLCDSEVQVVANLTPTDAVTVMEMLSQSFKNLRVKVWRRTIVTIFETESLPQSWLALLAKFDQVVVPTQFNLRTFEAAGVPAKKLVKVPYALDLEKFYPSTRPSRSRFQFLYVCDFNFRKGIDLLVEGYASAFTASDDVELVIKTMNLFTMGGQGILTLVEQHLRQRFGAAAMAHLPRIVLDVGTVNDDELRTLYQNADLNVSTDRANGWGMPTLEAMACGTPSAAIDYGGGAEILNASNGYPIPIRGLVPADGRLVDELPIYEGQQWADVSVSDVSAVLRNARDDLDRQRKAEFGLEWVKSFDFSIIGKAFKESVLT